MTYSFDELASAYRGIGLGTGDIVYVLSALWQVSDYENDSDDLPEVHYRALRDTISDEGTIVVSTASMNLCNTSTPFDPETTPSFNSGVFSEFVRSLDGARRSFHPFGSYAAIGPAAEFIVEDSSRYMFGPQTPESRLIELDAVQVNIGLPANINSTVGHIEQVMAVPYRYSKEFIHPVCREGKVALEPFYMYVRRLDVDVERNHCRRLFERLDGTLEIRSRPVGRGKVCSYSMKDFYREAVKIFAEDIYIWCDSPPSDRPYRN